MLCFVLVGCVVSTFVAWRLGAAFVDAVVPNPCVCHMPPGPPISALFALFFDGGIGEGGHCGPNGVYLLTVMLLSATLSYFLWRGLRGRQEAERGHGGASEDDSRTAKT